MVLNVIRFKCPTCHKIYKAEFEGMFSSIPMKIKLKFDEEIKNTIKNTNINLKNKRTLNDLNKLKKQNLRLIIAIKNYLAHNGAMEHMELHNAIRGI